MKRLWILLGVGLCLFGGMARGEDSMPEGFCDVAEQIPEIVLDIRYAGEDNFVGRPVDGYEAPKALLTWEAARALSAAQVYFVGQGLSLVVYDAYRPQRAVDDFAAWAKDPEDVKMREAYYPEIPKAQLFSKGYIAEKSGHSRGSTVDVGLLDAAGNPLDMGCGFDYFGPLAAHGAKGITAGQAANRTLLKEGMEACGFVAYRAEWWHYRLREEPYPDTYFDFPVR